MQATNNAAHAAMRETVDLLYRAFAHKDISLLRKVVTPDWQYIPESPGQFAGPGQDDSVTGLPDLFETPIH